MKRTMRPLIKRLFFMPLLAIFFMAIGLAHARSLLAVELISFTATGLVNGVELRWETATELGAAAFLLQRSQGGAFDTLTELLDANGQPYPGGLIEAEGSPTFGAVYIARDLTAVPGQTYTYQLIEVESDNQMSVIATVTALAGGSPTPTQIIIGGGTPPDTTGSTSTATPSNTAVTVSPSATSPAPVAATATASRTIITPTPAAAENQVAQAAPVNTTSPVSSQPIAPTPPAADNVAFAQAEATPEPAYPGQDAPPETETEEGAYPESVVTPLTIDVTETPYPANAFLPEAQPTPTIVGVVGSQSNGTPLTLTAAQTSSASESSTTILWLGFLAGLLIFVAAIAGSIVLFVRRRQ